VEAGGYDILFDSTTSQPESNNLQPNHEELSGRRIRSNTMF